MYQNFLWQNTPFRTHAPMLKLLRLSVAYPRTVVAIAGALTLLAALHVTGVRLRLDGRSLIPERHAAIAASDQAADLFAARDVIVVGLTAPATGIYAPAALRLLAELSAEIAGVEGIVPGSVNSLATVPRLFIEDDTLDLQPLLDRGTPLDAALGARIRRETSALGLDDGVLAAADGRAAAIYAEVERDADRGAVRRRLLELAARHAGGPVAVHLSGTAMAQAVLGEAAARDLARLVPLVLAVIAAILVLAFRHWAPALVSLAEIGVSLLWTIGLMGAHGQPVFVTTLALPVILLAIGVTDDVYALNRYFAAARETPHRPPAELAIETFSGVYRAVLTTAATTIVGLFSLLASDIEPQRVFGLFGGLSVLFSTLLTFTLVPALLVLLRPRVRPAAMTAPRFAETWMQRLPAGLRKVGPRRLLALAAAVTVAALALTVWRLRIEDNWIDNLPPASETARGDRAINRVLAGTNTLELMFDSGRPEGFLDPASFAALGAIEDALAASPLVGAVQSVFGDVLRVEAALAGQSYREVRAAVRSGARPLSRPQIEQALLLIESAGSAPGMERLEADYRRSRMTVFVRGANYSRMGAVLDLSGRAAREHLPAAPMTPFGDGWIGHLTIELLVVGQVASIGLAVLANFLLLVLLFRSVATALLALVPVVVSVLLVFAALAVAGAPLGTANSMFAAIALGIGVDYSIHLVASYRERIAGRTPPGEALAGALTHTGPAILTSAAAIVAGFAVLALSEVPPNRQLGILICLSLAVCAAVTLVLEPALLLARDSRDRLHRRRTHRR
jgi:uncharacterized protein